MQIPIDIQFRGMDRSAALEQAVRERIAPLAQIESRALGCHVTIEPTDHRHRQGTIHRFTIRLVVPGDELVVSREPRANHAHEDPYVALRDACDALERKLVERHRLLARSSRRSRAAGPAPRGSER